jgi:hypothetical protein
MTACKPLSHPSPSLVDPAEYRDLIDQLDRILSIYRDMLHCHPKRRVELMERIDGVLDERNRLAILAAL